MLTQTTGTVDMEDGTGTAVTLPTFPQLQKTVTLLTDAATGAVAGAQASASAATMSAAAAWASQEAAADSSAAASASAVAAHTAEVSGEGHATTAASQAAASESAAIAAATSADTASGRAADAAAFADIASAKAASASTSEADAAESAAEAQSWALTAQSAATGNLRYMGVLDASVGVFPSTPLKGDFWKISVSGLIDGTALQVGDHIVYSGSGWDRINNYESVAAVAGKTGNVVLDVLDIGGLAAALAQKAALTGSEFSGALLVNAGAAGSQVVTQRIGWADDKNKWAWALNSNASLSLYSYPGGIPTEVGNWASDGGVAVSKEVRTPILRIGGSKNGWIGVVDKANGEGQWWPAQASSDYYFFANGAAAGLYSASASWAWGWTYATRTLTVYGSLNVNGVTLQNQADSLRVDKALRVIGDIYQNSANNGPWVRQVRIFVQPSDPGAMASDGDLWIW